MSTAHEISNRIDIASRQRCEASQEGMPFVISHSAGGTPPVTWSSDLSLQEVQEASHVDQFQYQGLTMRERYQAELYEDDIQIAKEKQQSLTRMEQLQEGHHIPRDTSDWMQEQVMEIGADRCHNKWKEDVVEWVNKNPGPCFQYHA